MIDSRGFVLRNLGSQVGRGGGDPRRCGICEQAGIVRTPGWRYAITDSISLPLASPPGAGLIIGRGADTQAGRNTVAALARARITPAATVWVCHNIRSACCTRLSSKSCGKRATTVSAWHFERRPDR